MTTLMPRFPRLVLILSLAAATLATGCAEFGYQRVQLGQEPRAYRQAFPDDKTRRTPLGFCYAERDDLGRHDATVVLLTGDRRVAGKLHATHVERRGLFGAETNYQLRGELDPELLRLSEAGPIDTLRVIADELTSVRDDTFVRDAHDWIAVGLVRLVQHWPHVGDEGPAGARLTGTLDRVPSGGVARITVDTRGVFLIEYTQTVTP